MTAENPTPEKKKPRWRRWALEISIFIVVFFAFQAWQLRDTVRGPAPEFSSQQLDGSHFALAQWQATHAGKPVLLYFWAEWCPICKTTSGSVTSIADDWPVMSIATQSGDALAVGREMREHNYSWPTVIDTDGSIMKQFALPGVPGFVIIAPDGNIRFVSVGYTSEIGLRLRLWWAGR